MKFIDFVGHRNAEVELGPIEEPKVKFKTPLEAFEEVLEHEQYVTDRIDKLYGRRWAETQTVERAG